MKFKSTKKEIMANYVNVIKIGYCDLQYLLMYKSPIAYTSGVYGWNADVYDLGGGNAIVTGDRPFGNIRPNREIIEKYEKKASEASSMTPLKSHLETIRQYENKLFFNDLLKKFIEEVTNNG